MRSTTASGETRLLVWRRVREYAVPPSMIETATARRAAGDWAGACAAAHVDADLDPRAVARAHGREVAARLRADLRRLAPDLLRWHLPRIAPDGLLRPGLTVSLARYGPGLHLVVRTAPAWADAGQRLSLAVWDAARPAAGAHPHPRPDRRYRLDLHRHLWDATRAHELRDRAGCGEPPPGLPETAGCAVDRWPPEAALLLRAEGRTAGAVVVRLAGRRRLVLRIDPAEDGAVGVVGLASVVGGVRGGCGADAASRAVAVRVVDAPRGGALPVLPHAATWLPPDLELLRAGLLDPGRLHPLVAAALATATTESGPAPGAAAAAGNGGADRIVQCRGAVHRIGVRDGVLAALDHDPAEVRREELLARLGGPMLPCLRAVDDAHRRPGELEDVRARLDHGDTGGALAAVEALLGPDAVLRDGALSDDLAAAAARRVTHGLFRAGLTGLGPILPRQPAPASGHASRPRHSR